MTVLSRPDRSRGSHRTVPVAPRIAPAAGDKAFPTALDRIRAEFAAVLSDAGIPLVGVTASALGAAMIQHIEDHDRGLLFSLNGAAVPHGLNLDLDTTNASAPGEVPCRYASPPWNRSAAGCDGLVPSAGLDRGPLLQLACSIIRLRRLRISF